MEAVYAFHGLKAFNGFHANVYSLLGLLFLGDSGHALDDILRNIHPRNPVFHIPGHTYGF